MNIGEAFQLSASAPVRQGVERKMDHHRAGACANAGDLLVEGLTLRVGAHEPAEHDLRMKVRDHRLLRGDLCPIAKRHTRCAAWVALNSPDRRTRPDLA